MAWLGEELAEDQQDGATSFAPRCLKDVVEEELFARRRDLFSTLDLVFMDTTSLYFEGAGGQTLGRRGDLSPLEAMLCYKQLWRVERVFRTSKSLFATRPIFHRLDETIRGHVSCSFLALVMKKELEDRISAIAKPAADGNAAAESWSWPAILADLDSLTETEVEQDGKRFILRSAPRPAAGLALRAAGVALPPTSAPARRRLIPLHQPKCSAKALFQRRFAYLINALAIRGVEDQFDS